VKLRRCNFFEVGSVAEEGENLFNPQWQFHGGFEFMHGLADQRLTPISAIRLSKGSSFTHPRESEVKRSTLAPLDS